jgi:hypothetical protein
MAKAATTIALEEGEYALIIGQDAERMSVRTEGAELIGDGAAELPIPAALVAALAERLLHDPEFHDEVLAWYEEHLEDEDGEKAAGEE